MSTTPTTPQIPPPVSDSLMRWLKNMQAHMVYHGPSSDFISLGDAIRRLEYLESKFNSAPSPAAHPPITPAAPLTTSSQVTGNCNPAEPAAKAGEINRTPRTDAICKDYAGPLCMIGDQQFIPALFARQLERDLAARDAELARLKQVGARNQYESECFHALCARLWLAVGPDPEKIPGDTCDAKLANMLQTATERAERAERERETFYMEYRTKCDVETKALHQQLASLRAVADGLAEALEKINKDIPACDQNGQLYVLHFDGEGNELGQEFVDPVALCGHLSARIEEALARYRAASADGHARKEEAT